MSGKRLLRSFFDRPTLDVARELLGKVLVDSEGEKRLSGRIVEVEAYVGQSDLGCHARAGLTERNRSMWGPPGHAYVYFTYGMHWLLNFVTEGKGFPAAVLIRALEPLEGADKMRERRGDCKPGLLSDGPAKLCQALAIGKELDGSDLCTPKSRLFVEEPTEPTPFSITAHPRIGLNSVPEPWKSIPWNFKLEHLP